jgi:ATP-binding cassette subfamily B protein
MSMQGVEGEDKIDLNKEESKAIKLRSRRLLFSLIRPIRKRLAVSVSLVVISQAIRVVGPGLIALGIDYALPQAMNNNTAPLFLTVAGFITAAAATAILISSFLIYTTKTNQGVLFDLRNRLFEHSQKLSLQFHEKYTSGRVIARQTLSLIHI